MTAVLWVVGVLATWAVVSLALGLAIGRAIKITDEKEGRR